MNFLTKFLVASLFRRGVMPLAVLAVLLFVAQPKTSANTVAVVSGAAVTFLDSGSVATDFSAPFTAAQFAAAQTGTPAFLITPNGAYIPASDIPGALWIGTNANAGSLSGDTALYAISFNLPSVSAASLSVSYAVDNELGDANAGIYINGTALPVSTGIGGFNPVNTYTDASIGSLLVSGSNTIYFDAVNLGGPAGLLFSAQIAYTPSGTSSVPEPSSLLLAAGPLASIALALRKRLLGS